VGKVSTAQLVQPIANGALVLSLDTDFDGCMAIVQRLGRCEARLPRQLDERPQARGPEDGRIEIVQQFDWQVPIGSCSPAHLGNAGRALRRFRMLKELGIINRYPRLAVAQAAAANPLYRAWTKARKRSLR